MSTILVAVTFFALWLAFGWLPALIGIVGAAAWLLQRRPGHIMRVPAADVIQFPVIVKRICAWCQAVQQDGVEPATHGICPTCKARVDAELDVLEDRKRRVRMVARRPLDGPAAI